MGRIVRRYARPRAVALLALLLCPLALGQVAVAPTVQPETALDVLHQLADQADVIFAGQVVAIRRPNSGVIEIEFRVDQGIRGCATGTNYTLREWAGLWAGDNQRYRVGQQLLMLLHAPGAAGLSSPVGGFDGAIPIRQGGRGVGAQGSSIAPQRPYVDLRWLGTRLPRAVSYRSEPPSAGKPGGLPVRVPQQRWALAVPSGSQVDSGALVVTAGDGTGAVRSSVPAQQASVDAVIGLLSTWQTGKRAR